MLNKCSGSITIENLDVCSLVKMTGFVDAALAPQLREAFDKVLAHPYKHVVLDFSETTDLDTSGVGAIVYLFKRLHHQGLTLEFIGLQRQPLRKIRKLHLDAVIKMTPKVHRPG